MVTPTGVLSRGVPSKSIAMEPYVLRPSHVCFRRRGRPQSVRIALEQELSGNVAEAGAELLQVLCCGEDPAVFAFERWSRHAALQEAAAACAARIAREEACHDELLGGLRLALPTPRSDGALLDRLKGFYRALGTRDAFVHLTQIYALDSGVCIVLSALRGEGRPVGRNSTLAAILGRILHDEVGHVRDSRIIPRRHLARDSAGCREGTGPGDGNADLAARAVRRALNQAGLLASDLAYLIGHTTTPDELLPSNVSRVASLLGYRGPVAEFRQACTGFVNATLFAAGLCAAGGGRPIAVVGSETGSVFFDPMRAAEDSAQLVNFVQMGDGAGAIILSGEQTHTRTPRLSRLYHGRLETGLPPGLRLRTGGSQAPRPPDARAEFDHAAGLVREHGGALFQAALASAQAQGIDLTAMNYVLPHQANGRMDTLLAPHLPAKARVIVHADRVGNTGSAAIWLALDEARRNILTAGQCLLVLGAESTNYSFGGFIYEHA